MRDIQSEYEGGSVAPPARKTVDAFFAIIADTERQLKRADEMGKVVRERERELDEELYRAHCAVFEMEDEIEEVENGVDGGDAREG